MQLFADELPGVLEGLNAVLMAQCHEEHNVAQASRLVLSETQAGRLAPQKEDES